MLEYTKADGIMIARGALGNPFIFEDIINYLEKEETKKQRTNKEILQVIIKHINLEVEEKGEYTAVREMRKHIAWYTKGMQNSSNIRNEINTKNSKDELIKSLTEYFNKDMNI